MEAKSYTTLRLGLTSTKIHNVSLNLSKMKVHYKLLISARGILKKKLLFPILLLMKLKMQLLMPVLLGIIGLKSIKALIISKLALGIVLGFLIYQLCTKAGKVKSKSPTYKSTIQHLIKLQINKIFSRRYANANVDGSNGFIGTSSIHLWTTKHCPPIGLLQPQL